MAIVLQQRMPCMHAILSGAENRLSCLVEFTNVLPRNVRAKALIHKQGLVLLAEAQAFETAAEFGISASDI